MINKRKKGSWVKWLVLGVVLVALVALAIPTISGMISGGTTIGAMANQPSGDAGASMSEGSGSSSRNTTSVTRGSMKVTVSGSGKVSPTDTRSVYSQTSGTVDELDVKVGDSVKEGEIIMKLASDDLSTSIASLERTLFDAQIELAAVRDSGSSYNIYSPSAGRIKMMKVEEDDDVATTMKQYGYLCVISRDGKMKVEFEPTAGTTLNVGDKVNVWINSVSVEGRVEQLTGLNGNVSVTIDDDSYDVDQAVTVSTLLGEMLGEGVLAVNMPIPVTGVGGTVDNIYYEDNDTVGSGYRLFYLTGRTPSSDLQVALLAYEEARIALENAKSKQEGLLVRSPMDGVITSVDVTLGSKLEEGTLAFAMQSSSSFKAVASVDELDIVNVEPGQSVNVELDAYPNQVFTGTVQSISGVGTVEGGVATYEVSVSLDSDKSFMDGMTASIEVVTVNKEGVLTLPVEAISTSNGQNYVTLASGTQSMVQTGVSDGTNIEIVSGVNEGDQVQLTRTGNSGSTGNYSGASSGGNSGGSNRGGGNMGGGMMMPGGF
ncbi:efflux RND transporter periplasmic adaptor subunit [Eubacteriales bacterium OttesenSCG-928-N13]|nr:efflux RND transporter periplasmic adaptor subunit [Eubacteriales bacterium OttesenSCG-928-N13]